jgi:hypothetical protein
MTTLFYIEVTWGDLIITLLALFLVIFIPSFIWGFIRGWKARQRREYDNFPS